MLSAPVAHGKDAGPYRLTAPGPLGIQLEAGKHHDGPRDGKAVVARRVPDRVRAGNPRYDGVNQFVRVFGEGVVRAGENAGLCLGDAGRDQAGAVFGGWDDGAEMRGASGTKKADKEDGSFHVKERKPRAHQQRGAAALAAIEQPERERDQGERDEG